jgi:hypothetical protein
MSVIELPDGSVVTTSVGLKSFNPQKKSNGHPLTPHDVTLETPSGVAVVTLVSAYTPPPVKPVGPVTPSEPVPVGIPGKWALALDCGFNGTSMAPFAIGWAPGSPLQDHMAGGDELECYDPTHAVLDNGQLNINLTAEQQTVDYGYNGPLAEPVTREFTSAIVSTKGTWYWQKGMAVEYRMAFPVVDGKIANWPGGWACSDEPPLVGTALEVDLGEGLDGAVCFHVHYDGQAYPSLPATDPAFATDGAMHTVGAEWTDDDYIDFYYDGKHVGSEAVPSDSQPMCMIVTHAIDNEYGGPHLVPAQVGVDYFRAWSPTPATGVR